MFLCQKICTRGEKLSKIVKNCQKWPSNHQKLKLKKRNIFFLLLQCHNEPTFYMPKIVFIGRLGQLVANTKTKRKKLRRLTFDLLIQKSITPRQTSIKHFVCRFKLCKMVYANFSYVITHYYKSTRKLCSNRQILIKLTFDLIFSEKLTFQKKITTTVRIRLFKLINLICNKVMFSEEINHFLSYNRF